MSKPNRLLSVLLVFSVYSVWLFESIESAHGKKECLVDQSALNDLNRQREELKIKAKNLESREKELAEKEKALKEELRKIEEVRKEIEAAQFEVSRKNEAKVSKMVETFEKMSAKKAARIIAKIDDDLGVAAVSRISTPKLAKILGAMDPQTSSRLTELMALGKSNINKPQGKGGEKRNGIDG